MLKGIAMLFGIVIVVVIGLMIFIQYTQTSSYQGPLTDHFNGKQFFNAMPYKTHGFLDILRWKLHAKKTPWPKHVANTVQADLTPVIDGSIKVTFINHATVLIQSKQLTLLTDPVWSYRTSPFTWIGPHRVRDPGVALESLPKIDVIVISHNHYDHLDLTTLQRLANKFHPIILVPLGLKKLLARNGIENVFELDWWQTYKNTQTTITLLPTQHWSARWLNDKFKTLWGSYGIELGKFKIYFAGDAGYSKNFSLIKERWGSPDLAFLPIGAYEPEWFMQSNHMNPAESLQAHIDLEAKQSIGIHYGTFQLSDEGIDQPVVDLQKALKAHPSLNRPFKLLKVGETTTVK